jgi:hypothetical protein
MNLQDLSISDLAAVVKFLKEHHDYHAERIEDDPNGADADCRESTKTFCLEAAIDAHKELKASFWRRKRGTLPA